MWSGIGQSGLGGRNRNPYAQGGALFNREGQYFGFLPSGMAGYDPSLRGGRTLGGVGDNYAYQQSGTQGAGGFWNPEPAQQGYQNPYPNPLADLLKNIGGMDFGMGGGGGGWGSPAMGGEFTYNTGISAAPAISPDDQAKNVAKLRATPGGGPALGIPLNDAQDASLRRQQQDYARMSGYRAANDYSNTVNQGESALQQSQDAAKAASGQAHQQFSNRIQAHRFNQASARRNAQLGILGDLMGMFGGMFG
jgi:hypothetical protein